MPPNKRAHARFCKRSCQQAQWQKKNRKRQRRETPKRMDPFRRQVVKFAPKGAVAYRLEIRIPNSYANERFPLGRTYRWDGYYDSRPYYSLRPFERPRVPKAGIHAVFYVDAEGNDIRPIPRELACGLYIPVAFPRRKKKRSPETPRPTTPPPRTGPSPGNARTRSAGDAPRSAPAPTPVGDLPIPAEPVEDSASPKSPSGKPVLALLSDRRSCPASDGARTLSPGRQQTGRVTIGQERSTATHDRRRHRAVVLLEACRQTRGDALPLNRKGWRASAPVLAARTRRFEASARRGRHATSRHTLLELARLPARNLRSPLRWLERYQALLLSAGRMLPVRMSHALSRAASCRAGESPAMEAYFSAFKQRIWAVAPEGGDGGGLPPQEKGIGFVRTGCKCPRKSHAKRRMTRRTLPSEYGLLDQSRHQRKQRSAHFPPPDMSSVFAVGRSGGDGNHAASARFMLRSARGCLMKTSLEHLPEPKQAQLRAITAIFCEGAPVEMLILFGSHARGDWVEDPETGYLSDYDVLAVVESEKLAKDLVLWNELEGRARAVAEKTPVTLIVHDLKFLNHEIRIGQYFFADIVNEGVLLYDSRKFQLAKPKALNAQERLQLAERNFTNWFDSASKFWRGSRYYSAQRWLKESAFLLHQATERYYHGALLVLTGYKQRTHDIEKLGNLAGAQHPLLVDVLPKTEPSDAHLFDLLKRAYIDARYSMSYHITAEELNTLQARVIVLGERVRVACLEKIATFCGAEAVNPNLPLPPQMQEPLLQNLPPLPSDPREFEQWAQSLADLSAQRGREEGRQEGKAAAILEVLRTRGVDVPPEIAQRIASCADPAELAAWLTRAVTAKSAKEVVGG